MEELFDSCVLAATAGIGESGEFAQGGAESLIDKYEWFTVARIIKARRTGNLDNQLKLMALASGLPGTIVADIKLHEESVAQEPIPSLKGTLSFIDDFLALDEESLKLKVDETVTDEDISASSANFDLDMVSEELAEIYLAQGNKTMALEIYNKLSLLNPEKSVYFAELISSINKN